MGSPAAQGLPVVAYMCPMCSYVSYSPCPLQEREQRALSHTQRALELQQLAASSDSSLGVSQLSAAAQRCTTEAEEAAQVAALARAEAARLAGPGPALGSAAENPAPVPLSMAAVPTGAQPSSDIPVLTSASLPTAEEAAVTAAAAEGAVQLRVSAGPEADEQPQLSRLSLEVIRGLSTDMEAAMQQLVASAHSSSSAAAPPGAEPRSPEEDPSRDMGTGFEPSQGLPNFHTSTLAASPSTQLPQLPDQASWQFPTVSTAPFPGLAVAAGIPALPEQATGDRVEGQGPSGMQIHLMHQLDGLERSIRRVERQVSSTKQTRRRLKNASLPAQVILDS